MNVLNVLEQIAFKSDKLNKISLFDTDKFFCDIYCIKPGQSQKVHSHQESDKVYFVLEGRGKLIIGSESREVGPNEIALAPTGQLHGLMNESGNNLVLLVFMAPKP